MTARLMDLVLPIGTALFVGSLVEATPQPLPGPVRVIGIAVGLGQGLALFWRRSHPRLVMAVTALGGLIVMNLAPEGLLPYAALVALWSLATTQRPSVSLLGLAGALLATVPSWPTAAPGDAEFVMVLVVVVWAFGEATRNRLIAAEQTSRRVIAAEHAQLARDLHDVIAHSVSVMVIQAAAADDVFDAAPDRARVALRTIEATGREAMAELRSLLAALGPGDGGSAARPAPDLDALDTLVEPVRSLGLSVELRREGDRGIVVPAGVALSAFRIVQEALTNTVRHARAAHVEIQVGVGPSAVEVSVTDDGAGPAGIAPEAGAGRGIPGMRERAVMLGGTLDAGPGPDGGFQVRARLPLAAPR